MGISKVFLAGTAVAELYDKVVTELDRGIDTATIKFPASVFPHQNDEVLILKDVADLTNLEGIYHFENTLKDESGHGRDWTAEGAISYVDGKFGKAVYLDGTSRLKQATPFTFPGKFHIFIYIKRDSSADIDSVFGNSGDISANASKIAFGGSTGAIPKNNLFVRIVDGGASANADIGYTDSMNGNWQLLAIKRDPSNVISASLNNGAYVTIGTLAGTHSIDTLGDNPNASQKWKGAFDVPRLYSDNLQTADCNGIYNLKNLTSTIKFGGNVSSIDDNVHPRTVECKSLGNQVGQTKVQNKVYNNQTVDDIVEDLINTNTTLTFVRGASTQISPSLSQFTATGYLIDLVNALAGMGNKTFFTDGLGQFHWDDNSAVQAPLTYTHGSNAVITISGKDDTQLANRITVQGQDLEYQNTEAFIGDGSTTVFTTTFIITNALVLVNDVVQIADQDYSYNTQNKQITFVTAPAVGASVSVQYTYDKPISIQCVDQPSIDANGVYDKDLPAPWITTTGDATRFGQLYLQAFKDVKLRVTVKIPRQDVQVASNLVVYLVNSIKAINGTFVIKSVTWEYPGITTLDCGEFTFSDFELHKQVLQALHSLQQLTASSIQLTNFKNIPENMAPVETVTKKNLSLAYYNSASYYSDAQVYSE